ncbi:MAG: dihydropteroate synthase [Alphaproteobacteria bacterium]|nr:dihydropteroate synthase [Alphaproteobacteria bacterium]MBV9693296.1 dihydropteroate synthase [Alphaproteobacteria bacterium]
MSLKLLGILNITEDSFSDGGKFLDPAAALIEAERLAKESDAIDLGAASSRPGAVAVAPDVEIARLAPVVDALKRADAPISIDSFSPEVQRWALSRSVAYLNDVNGFADASFYPELAASDAKLIVMFSVEGAGPATRLFVPAAELFDRIVGFFDRRLAAFARAGIAQERIILDPGMGLFLGSDPEASFTVLRRLSDLKARFGLPLLVSVSRKSFLRDLVHKPVSQIGPATLAAELFAVRQGADYIRTHAPGALRDLLMVFETLANQA